MLHIVLLIYWPIMGYQNGSELEACPTMSLLKCLNLLNCSQQEKLHINHGTIRFPEVGLFIILISLLLIPHIVFLIPRLIQKSFWWIYGSHPSYAISPSLLSYLYPEKFSKIGGTVFLVTPWIVYYLWAPKMTLFLKRHFLYFTFVFYLGA